MSKAFQELPANRTYRRYGPNDRMTPRRTCRDRRGLASGCHQGQRQAICGSKPAMLRCFHWVTGPNSYGDWRLLSLAYGDWRLLSLGRSPIGSERLIHMRANRSKSARRSGSFMFSARDKHSNALARYSLAGFMARLAAEVLPKSTKSR